MAVMAPPPFPVNDVTADQRVTRHGVGLAELEALLAARGERSRPRITFLDGVLELMSPSWNHERIKKRLAMLLEAYLFARGLPFAACGSWTLRRPGVAASAEADESYLFGEADGRALPDLAIEVAWTERGIDKLEVYRQLGVPEVWFCVDGRLDVYHLVGDAYDHRSRSAALPELDLALIAGLLEGGSDHAALAALHAALAADAQ
jgi:Uma2 family endonuclease